MVWVKGFFFSSSYAFLAIFFSSHWCRQFPFLSCWVNVIFLKIYDSMSARAQIIDNDDGKHFSLSYQMSPTQNCCCCCLNSFAKHVTLCVPNPWCDRKIIHCKHTMHNINRQCKSNLVALTTKTLWQSHWIVLCSKSQSEIGEVSRKRWHDRFYWT